jgi:hypothetical protein
LRTKYTAGMVKIPRRDAAYSICECEIMAGNDGALGWPAQSA